MLTPMKQVLISKVGRPEVLRLQDGEEPEVGAHDVRIHVAAAGVNFADIMARIGLYPDAPKLPAVVGYEVSGIIDKVGPDVRNLKVGDRVVAMTRFGGYSEKVVIPSNRAIGIPEQLDLLEAAAMPVNYLTAWTMLVHLGNVKNGDLVLIHSVGGGVGQAALQIAKHFGARVLGTASPNKHERLEKMGVDHCLNYSNFETQVLDITDGRGVDIILDPLGGKQSKMNYRCLASLGRLYLFGMSSAAPSKSRKLWRALLSLFQLPTFRPVDLMNTNRGVQGINMGRLWHRGDELTAMLVEMMELVQAGALRPVVDRYFSFAQAHEAHHYIQDRKNIGKVLLTPDDAPSPSPPALEEGVRTLASPTS